MKFSLSISVMFCCLAALGCKSAYSSLVKTSGGDVCEFTYKPILRETYKYVTEVQLLDNSFSGILLFKPMEDGSLRIVFTDPFGVKFFDLGFNETDEFEKHFMLPQMDRKAVVNLLKKDFSMLLMRYDPKTAESFTDGERTHTAFKLNKGKVYYVSSPDCGHIEKIENGSKRKPVVQIFLKGQGNAMPDSFVIDHKKVNFTIQSKHLIE